MISAATRERGKETAHIGLIKRIEVGVLFSRPVSKALERLDKNVDLDVPDFDREAFVEARDAVLRMLYREVIPVGGWRDYLRRLRDPADLA